MGTWDQGKQKKLGKKTRLYLPTLPGCAAWARLTMRDATMAVHFATRSSARIIHSFVVPIAASVCTMVVLPIGWGFGSIKSVLAVARRSSRTR
mmetsp:Transcript_26881/g.63005  ORF Transcript_26881/g.63005 Transcript_26881/m.63005 type:complete len:93 (+) Transcript_26881:906-1184(+)